MSNFTNLIVLFKARFSQFIEEICYDFSVPEKKFIRNLLWGILKSKSVFMTDIGRALEESIPFKSVEMRLTRGAQEFYYPKLIDRLSERIAKIVTSPIRICVDESDLNKNQARKIEDLCVVRDGSKAGDSFVNGYHMTGIAIIGGNENYVFPLCLNIYSSASVGYTSIYDQTTRCLSYPLYMLEQKNIIPIVSFDRGYDDAKYVKYCEEMGVFYVIRAREMRKYTINKQIMTIDDIGANFKGKYSFNYEDIDGTKHYVKAGSLKVYHKNFGKTNIVFEKHSETDYRYYLTNVSQALKKNCAAVLKAYRMRWRIEELFRFVKQCFNLENMLVRTLNAMNTMTAILVLAVNFMTEIMMEKGALYEGILNAWPQISSNEIRKQKLREFGRYGFGYYSFLQGIAAMLRHASTPPKIKKRIRKKKEHQMTIFECIKEN